MRTKWLGFPVCAVLGLGVLSSSCSHGSRSSQTQVAALAPTTPPPTAPEPPRSPARLATLLAEYDRLVAATPPDPAAIARARESIDRVAAQRDAHVSRLYWYTDLEEAKAEAAKSGRPILSLRLLGHLDDELSCANSRLFRLTLYSNEKVSKFLRDTYVLHWSSERPATTMTLDFGDGRVVKRTITGNSVHYVLDSRGRIIDALPGLYGPTGFEKTLRESLDVARASGDLPSDDESMKAVAKYHTHATWRLTATWRRHLERAYGDMYLDQVKDAKLPQPVGVSWPHPVYSSLPAAVVNQLTISKADTEAPTLALLQPEIHVSEPWEGWSKVAEKGVPMEHIDAQSRTLIESKHPRDWSSKDASNLDPKKLANRFSNFEKRLTEEQLRNEFALHGSIHTHLSKPARVAFGSANEFIYAKVFLTPKSDAWLGLMPTEALTGIDDDGIVATAVSPATPATPTTPTTL